jgi:hypothetical protein
LAGPPSLDSCTRDVYADDLRIPLPLALTMALKIAQAVAHLHQHGVMHGDLYAHNILWNPANGDAVLSDFGAATLLPSGDVTLCRQLQALEVRAFGGLLSELLACAESDPYPTEGAAQMHGLAQACLCPKPAERPNMAEAAECIRLCL